MTQGPSKLRCVLKGGVVLLLISVVGYALVYTLFDRGIVWFVYPDRAVYPVRGIDVSHHQGPIEWDKTLADDVSFVFLKASEADDWVDSRYHEHVSDLAGRDVRTAPYHFYSLAYGGAEQAEHFVNTALWHQHNLPPAVDLEFGGNSSKRPTVEEFAREFTIFMDTLQARTGQYPLVYTTEEFYEVYLADSFSECTYWWRNIYREPAEPGWLFWQYHSRARVAGIDGPVDLNVYAHSELGDIVPNNCSL